MSYYEVLHQIDYFETGSKVINLPRKNETSVPEMYSLYMV